MIGFKVFTSDLRSPVRGGDPAWDGSLPHDLPAVEVDTSFDACGVGWHFCREGHEALRIVGLWPDGRPSRLFRVETERAYRRGDKYRSANLRIVEEVQDMRPHVEALSEPFDVRYRAEMVDAQLAWFVALGRPQYDPEAVEAGLRAALVARGLDGWTLRRFDSAMAAEVAEAAEDAWAAGAAGDAWDAGAARAARAAWAAEAAWAARAARAVSTAWAAWDIWAARDARDAWNARDAWTSRAARDALSVRYASRMGWTPHPADLLTVGLLESYGAGLGIAVPTAPHELGWAMDGDEAA